MTPARARTFRRVRRITSLVLMAAVAVSAVISVATAVLVARGVLADTVERRLDQEIDAARSSPDPVAIDEVDARGRVEVPGDDLDEPGEVDEPGGRAELRGLVLDAARGDEPLERSFTLGGRAVRARAVPLDPETSTAGDTPVLVAVTSAHPAAVDSLTVRLLVVQGLVLLVLALVALVVARRSTRTLDALFRQQDRLMLAVAHEIRSPLSRALAAVDDGLDGAVDGGSALRRTATHVETTSELIDDLLEMTRVMSGAVAPPEESVALHEVAADAARATVVGEATVELDLRPLTVVGSERLLRRAVSNLVRNAARHAYRDDPGTIRVRVDADGVAVLDDGPGVSADRLEDLRYERPLAARQPGAGLGLNLCGWVAEMHGGRLVLANRPEGGFEARLDLPPDLSAADEEGGTR